MAANIIFLPVQEISDGKDILIQSMIYSKMGKDHPARDILVSYLQNRFHLMTNGEILIVKKCVI